VQVIGLCTLGVTSGALLTGCGNDQAEQGKQSMDKVNQAENVVNQKADQKPPVTYEDDSMGEKKKQLTNQSNADNSPPIVVFSERKQHLIEPLFKKFTQQTGIDVQYQTDSAQPLLARIKAEGERSQADIFMAVDAGNLWSAANMGVLQSIKSQTLEDNVPAKLQDSKNRWFGLSQRARTIVHSTKNVKPADLSTYEDLADPKWKGKLCLRTSKKVYNQSLVAMMIARLGEERTSEVVKGWVSNLATPVFSSDSLLISAIASGKCEVGIVNTYYFAEEISSKPDLPVALFWANQDTSGVHMNISGAGITKHAPHKENAIKLLEWLSSNDAQEEFARLNYEFPVKQGVEVDPIVKGWGPYKAETAPIQKAGEMQRQAVMLMDRAGYK